MGTVDALVRIQALDGTWETCGADRAIGIDPETVQLVSDEWGPKTASFDLHRSPIAIWPDLGAYAPVEVEVGGVLVWDGRTEETPIHSGSEQIINVQCDGWQYHTDDDVYQRAYVHSKLSDWKDVRVSPGAPLTSYTSAPQIQAGKGVISLTWPQGQATNGRAGVVLDLGPTTLAERAVIAWSLTAASAVNRAVYLGWGTTPNGPDAIEAIHLGIEAASGTYSLTLPTPSRYVYLIHDANSHTATADETFKVTAASIFASTSYEKAGESILTGDVVVADAIERGTLLLSNDLSQIAPVTFTIPDFVLSKATTPREAIEAVNAYYNHITKLLTGRRMSFQPRPTSATLEIGAWSGAQIEDASANNGAEIYNRAIVEATGPEGSPVEVERTAVQQPGVLYIARESPAAENPSFTANTASWTVGGGGTLSRDTEPADYHTTPACGEWALGAGPQTLSEAFSGTFHEGRSYAMTVFLKTTVATAIKLSFGVAGDYVKLATFIGVPWQSFTLVWIPRKTYAAGVTFTALLTGTGIVYVDDVSLEVAEPTLIDRRGFRRTKVIQSQSAITTTEGEQLADIFLQSHMTTPFKGSVAVVAGGVRMVLGGQPIHPSLLLLHTQELLRLSHLTDPDTGGVGRDGTIAEVSYTHKDQKASVTLDDKRGNFDALLARLAVVQSVSS